MTEYHLHTPIDEETIAGLNVGDTIYITGKVFTARDEAHMELLEHGEPEGLDTTGLGLYHCGPVMRQVEGDWRVVSAGPTTSFRMESLEPRFLDMFGVKVIIGKGGMGPGTLESLRKHNVVYASFTGGAGALAARGLGRVVDVHYLEELGMPEAVWIFEAVDFGPLVVSMDAHGNSLYADVDKQTAGNLKRVLERKGLS